MGKPRTISVNQKKKGKSAVFEVIVNGKLFKNYKEAPSLSRILKDYGKKK
jgi:hypothetical protein